MVASSIGLERPAVEPEQKLVDAVLDVRLVKRRAAGAEMHDRMTRHH